MPTTQAKRLDAETTRNLKIVAGVLAALMVVAFVARTSHSAASAPATPPAPTRAAVLDAAWASQSATICKAWHDSTADGVTYTDAKAVAHDTVVGGNVTEADFTYLWSKALRDC